MEEEDSENGLFFERVLNSNIFSLSEIEMIKSNRSLYEKCYLLGVIDAEIY